jgi:hypothetical protein
VGEELDDRERLRRGLEEGGEVGGVEVHGRVAVGAAGRARAPDAERPERVRPARRRAEEGGEDDEEAGRRRRRRGGHGSRRARISRLPGRDLVIRFGHLPPSVESSRLD